MSSTEKITELRTGFRDVYDMYYQGWQNAVTEMQRDVEMYLDAQFDRKEHAWASKEGRSLYVFNKMARQVDLLHGYEIRNRHILKIGPIGREDDLPCRQHTGLIMNTMASAEGYDILSEGFRWGSLVSGSNLFEIWRDRHGNLQFARRGHNTFLLDPMLSRPDLSDCGGILTGDWIREDRIKMLLPSGAEGIPKTKPLQSSGRWEYLRHKPLGLKDDVRLLSKMRCGAMRGWRITSPRISGFRTAFRALVSMKSLRTR